MVKLKMGNYIFKMRILKIDKDVVAVSSKCEEDFHVLFLDYDGVKKSTVLKNIVELQDHFGLSEFYILRTSKNSYHAICLDKMLFIECIELSLRANSDVYYIARSLIRGSFFLRLSSKHDKSPPVLVETLKPRHLENYAIKSRSHASMLNTFLSAKIDLSQGFDSYTKAIVENYASLE